MPPLLFIELFTQCLLVAGTGFFYLTKEIDVSVSNNISIRAKTFSPESKQYHC